MDNEAERAALKRCTKQVFKIYGISVNNPKLPHAIPPSEASEHAHFDLGSPVSVGLAPSVAVPVSPCSMQQPATHGWEANAAAAAAGGVNTLSTPSCHWQAPPSTNGESAATINHAAIQAPSTAAAAASGIKEKSWSLGRDLPEPVQCSTHSQHVQHMASAPAVTAGAKVGSKRSRDELHASSPTSAPTASSDSGSESDSDDDDADGIRPAQAAEVQRSPEDELWDRFFEEDCKPQHQCPIRRSRTVSPIAASELPGSDDPACCPQGPSAVGSFGGLQGLSTTAPQASTAQARTAPAAAQHHHLDAGACGQALPSQPEQLALPSVHGLEALPAIDGTTGSCLELASQPSNCLGTKGCRDPERVADGRPAASTFHPPVAGTTLPVVTA